MGKLCLTKADINALRKPWAALKQALLDVKSLYIPLLGVLLVLCTDAVGTGVGAVLLAQCSEDPNDQAPVCYFLRTFGGNTVVSLFLHKALNNANPLAQFKLSLTELDMKKHMTMHCRGVDQQMTDWLLQTKEHLCPNKLPVSDAPDMADTTIGGNIVEYIISDLTGKDIDSDDDIDAAEATAMALTPMDDNTAAAATDKPASAASNNAVFYGNDGGPAFLMWAQQYSTLVQALNVPSPTNFTDCQHDDDEIQHWIRMCQARNDVISKLMPDLNKVEKKRLHGDVLYHFANRHGSTDAVGTWVLVLTQQVAHEYVKLIHEVLAYATYTHSLNFILQHLWCPSLYTVIKVVCRCHHTCQVIVIQMLMHMPMVMLQLHNPRKHIYIDLCHVALDALVAVDSASGFLQVYPILNQIAATLIDTLRMGWFAKYGHLHLLSSVNGLQLTLATFKDFLHSEGVQHITTSPYHLQADIAEAAVKKFKTLLQWCWECNDKCTS
ncbi:hypothetical protein H4S08_004743 [Coemansia sp. RSA 1365]|nr:hypothetical protein H4S08_004743 [Coemansia sp. RSA 1365]